LLKSLSEVATSPEGKIITNPPLFINSMASFLDFILSFRASLLISSLNGKR
jgi:hypothetical protein